MTTDYDKMKNQLLEWRVGFREHTWTAEENDGTPVKVIQCEEGMDKVNGYTCFMVEFVFNMDGKFLEIGAWE